MTHVQIVLQGRQITRREESELILATLALIDSLECTDSGGTMVSVENGRYSTRPPVDEEVQVGIQLAHPTVSAQDRARITWAAVAMLQAVLGKNPGTTYQIQIADAAPEEESRCREA